MYVTRSFTQSKQISTTIYPYRLTERVDSFKIKNGSGRRNFLEKKSLYVYTFNSVAQKSQNSSTI